ncbi:PQQ-like beta-propeller repeat protein [soil metagenome]
MRILFAITALWFVAADWPQFQGPQRDGTSSETITAWKDAPKELWKVAIGEAHSSPVVASGIVYAFYRTPGKDDDSDLEVLAAFDAVTGTKKWEKSTTRVAYKTIFGSGPQGTPTVSDGRIFTYGNSGILTARDAATGDLQWTIDTLKDFSAKNLFFGISTSPLVIDKKVIVTVGGKGAGIVAFDIDTGKVAWQATDDPTSYSSPIAHGKQITFLTGSHLRGLNTGGKELWSFPFKDRANESSTMPVVLGDTVIGSSITRGSVSLTIKDGKATQTWDNKALTCFFSTPVVVDKHLYMINGVKGNKSAFDAAVNLRCVELATGKMIWEKPSVGRYHAALVKLKDNTLLMHDDNGYLSLIASNPKEYQELARTKVCGPTWASPAVVDGVVYLRDNKNLIALSLK